MFSELSTSEKLQKAIQEGGEIALRFQSSQIGTEHLLYGICTVKESFACKTLKDFGVTDVKILNLFRENGKEVDEIGESVSLTPRTKELLAVAANIASKLGHKFIEIEHAIYSLLIMEDCFAVRILSGHFRVNIIDIKRVLAAYLQGEIPNTAYRQNRVQPSEAAEQKSEEVLKSTLPESLLEMGTDFTLKARQGKFGPVIGREKELEQAIEVLGRKTKNNPVLIGPPGVGKTAVVEGLAQAIVKGNVPESLKNKQIFSLEIGHLMAGTKYRGAMEEKLKEVVDYIVDNPDIIVFIDEIHSLIMAGSEKGETTPADMLKPYLSRGEFRTIGATTTEEYRKFIEKDKALERRFQPIMLEPPSVEDTIKILEGVRESYEAYHKIKITDDALKAAAVLSDRYITERNLPDKAIDLVDQACSRAKTNFSMRPAALVEKEEKVKQLNASRDEANLARDYEKSAFLQQQIKLLEDAIQKMISETSKEPAAPKTSISEAEIAEVVARWTGIPVTKITESEKEKLLNLEKIFHKRVIGQSQAVEAVAKAIRRSRMGIHDNKRPIGSFLFMGQTGTGKTELSKAIAEAMFDEERNIIRLDMSEYMDKFSVTRLIGAPPGYVGYDEGGQLTEAVRRKPYSVVLFDEIEKAHPDVFNALLQVLDDGRLTDGQGVTVSFRNTIIIMTSNLGASEIQHRKLGFEDTNADVPQRTNREIYLEALKKRFRPEFINRIDCICIFEPLSNADLTKIAKLMISNLNKRLREQGIELKLTEDALDYIVRRGSDAEYGARPLKRYIQNEVENRIAELMLLGQIRKQGIIIIDVDDEKLTFCDG